jgi:Fe-S-cluster containining protein
MKLDVIGQSEDSTTRPWYADGLKFTCTQCGNCCTGGPGYVWISREEVRRLAEHLQMSVEQTMQRYCRKIGGRISLKEQRSPAGLYDCIFLEEVPAERRIDGQVVRFSKRTCSIYPVRPLQCRTWPFWDGNLQSRRAWEIAHRKCPGMDVGKTYSFEQIERIRTASDWPTSPPTSSTRSRSK